MSVLFRRWLHYVTLAMFPLFFLGIFSQVYLVQGIANTLTTTSAMTTTVVYLHTRLSYRTLLGLSTRQVFLSLALPVITASVISLFLGYSMANLVNVTVLSVISYLCLYNK